MEDLGEFLISCPKQRLGHKGEAHHTEIALRLDLLFVLAFLLSSAKRKAGEDHCRWLLLSHDYARLGSYLGHTVNGLSTHIREYAGFNLLMKLSKSLKKINIV